MRIGWSDQDAPFPGEVIDRFKRAQVGEHHHGPWHGALLLLNSGSVVSARDGSSSLRQGTCVWLAKGDLETYDLSQDARGTLAMVRFAPGQRFPVSSRLVVATPLLYAVIGRLAELEINSCPVRASYEEVAVEEMLRDLDAVDAAQIPRSTQLQLWALDFMEHPRVTTTKEEAAKATRMSARSFTRHFKQETGEDFRSWKMRALTTKAKSLLYYGRTVSEVSAELAYESVGSFISMFKEMTGKTPSDYVKEPKAWSEHASRTAVTKSGKGSLSRDERAT